MVSSFHSVIASNARCKDTDRRYERLKFVLEKSAVYSSILKARMDEDKAKQQAASKEIATRRAATAKTPLAKRTTAVQKWRGKKRQRVHDSDSSDSEASRTKRTKHDEQVEEDEELPIFPQPSLITGAKLKNYQLEGLQWMVSLDQNGISGILGLFVLFWGQHDSC